MPRLTRYDVHQNVPLSNFGLAYMNRQGSIGAWLPTPVPVKKKTDSFYKLTVENWFRNQATVVGDGAVIPKVDFTGSTDTYTAVQYGIGTVITEQQRDNADDWWKLLQRKTLFISKLIELQKEARVASLLFNTTTWTGAALTTAVSTAWSNSSATPLKDVITACTKVEDGRSLPVNAILFGRAPWRNFMTHPEVIRGLFGEGADAVGKGVYPQVTPEKVAGYFSQYSGVPVKVYVGRMSADASREGGTASRSGLWGSYVWVGHVTDSPDDTEPTAVAAFRQKFQIFSYFVQERRSDVVDGLEVCTEKVCDQYCAHLLSGM